MTEPHDFSLDDLFRRCFESLPADPVERRAFFRRQIEDCIRYTEARFGSSSAEHYGEFDG